VWYHPYWGEGLAIWYWPCLHCDYEVERAFYFDGHGIKLLEDCDQMTWVPHQAQLQGIYKRDNNVLDLMETQAEFDKFCTSWDLMVMIDSFEQIWLAFVMKEKFGKTWDGNEWQKGHNQGSGEEEAGL
jgi:hypothetical protein